MVMSTYVRRPRYFQDSSSVAHQSWWCISGPCGVYHFVPTGPSYMYMRPNTHPGFLFWGGNFDFDILQLHPTRSIIFVDARYGPRQPLRGSSCSPGHQSPSFPIPQDRTCASPGSRISPQVRPNPGPRHPRGFCCDKSGDELDVISRRWCSPPYTTSLAPFC